MIKTYTYTSRNYIEIIPVKSGRLIFIIIQLASANISAASRCFMCFVIVCRAASLCSLFVCFVHFFRNLFIRVGDRWRCRRSAPAIRVNSLLIFHSTFYLGAVNLNGLVQNGFSNIVFRTKLFELRTIPLRYSRYVHQCSFCL